MDVASPRHWWTVFAAGMLYAGAASGRWRVAAAHSRS